MRFLEAGFPALVDQYDRLYATKYAPKDYAERVRRTVGMLKARYGLAGRQRRAADAKDAPETVAASSEARDASQGAFRWTV